MDGNPTVSCAALAEALDEPLAGTAAVARSWLAIEQYARTAAETSAAHYAADRSQQS